MIQDVFPPIYTWPIVGMLASVSFGRLALALTVATGAVTAGSFFGGLVLVDGDGLGPAVAEDAVLVLLQSPVPVLHSGGNIVFSQF